MLGSWRALLRYLADGHIEIDNNAAERALRAVALERKNYLFAGGACRGWVNVCPTRDREITIVSPGLLEGADFVYDTIQALMRRGTNSFTMAAFVSPMSVADAHANPAYATWPQVLCRIADRVDVRVPHSDVGAMELFGGSWIVAESPWVVHSWLAAELDQGL